MSVLSSEGEENEMNKIINGDCIEVMKGFDENSIDCIVTDPPYGLNFMGKSWDKALPPKQAFVEMCRVLKPGALAFVMSSPRQDLMWRMGQLLEESGFSLKQSFMSWIFNVGFPKSYDIAKGIDSKLGTAPSSDLAKKWSGWKSVTGLKPALEVIFMVQKPLSEKTIVDNVLKWGTGAMNVDACRIPIQDEQIKSHLSDHDTMNIYGKYNDIFYEQNERGRFPANIVVSDDALNDGKITKSTMLDGNTFKKDADGVDPHNVYSGFGNEPFERGYVDVGSNSRYFDLDAWATHNGILQVPKASTSERNVGLEEFEKQHVPTAGLEGLILNGKEKPRSDRRNIHPCVKPIKLMSYLITLGCPKNGVVLDPFVGSGTTCVAAKRLGRKWIGIELNEEYFKIAVERLEKEAETLGSFFKGEVE